MVINMHITAKLLNKIPNIKCFILPFDAKDNI